jgi:hypothetical protein
MTMKPEYFLWHSILSEKIMHILIWIAFLPVALFGRYVQEVQADSNPLWLGVVRADKTIVPFAMNDEITWSNPWPKGRQIDKYDLPDTTFNRLDRIPKTWHAPLPAVPREWYVSGANGFSNKVTITRPVTVYSWCEAYWGLLIGNAEIPVNTHKGVLIDSFAASEKVQTTPVFSVKNGTAEYSSLLAFIRPIFEKAEANEKTGTDVLFPLTERSTPSLKKQGMILKSPKDLSPQDRSRSELVLVRLDCVKTESDKSAIFHFEIERDYSKLMPPRSLMTRSCMEGWIAANSKGKLSIITWDFGFENDAGGAIKRVTPLGTIVLGGKTLWIVRNRGYESETYSVLEIGYSSVKVLIETYGGGC